MKAVTYNSERDVKTQVKKLLTAHEWLWWMPPANGYGRAGIADINAVRHGEFLAVETKFGKNTATVMQRKFLAQVLQAGGYALVVNETNITQFAQWLGLHDRTTMPRTTRPLSDADSTLQHELTVALTPPA